MADKAFGWHQFGNHERTEGDTISDPIDTLVGDLPNGIADRGDQIGNRFFSCCGTRANRSCFC